MLLVGQLLLIGGEREPLRLAELAKGRMRSKTAELVWQEFYRLMMAHFAARGPMHEAALPADEDPDRLSFLHGVRVVQRRMARYVAISPQEKKTLRQSCCKRFCRKA